METSANLIIQYIIVGLILVGVVVWILRKIIILGKRGNAKSCCGCSLANACGKKESVRRDSIKCDRQQKNIPHENN